MESRRLFSSQGQYLDQLIRQAAADLAVGYTAQKAQTLHLLQTLSTESTGARYYKQGEIAPAGSVLPQTLESTPLINLNSFRSDGRFAGIDGTGFSTVIIDTGIDRNHPFFGSDANGNGVADRIIYSFDFSGSNDADASDFDGHGSNVASIAASSDTTYGGMAPGANIIALKVFPDDASQGAWDSDIQEALQWVIANATTYNVASVNLSLGGGNFTYTDFVSSYVDEFAALASQNVIVSVASGNGYTGAVGVSHPSNNNDVISVGAVYDGNVGGFTYGTGATAFTTAADVITPFTQRHAKLLDILAPGAVITGADASGGLISMHGTSQAAPHIAGIAVLAQQLAMQELGRRLTTDEFRALLRSTGAAVVDGDDEDDNVPNTGLTFRRVDVLALGNAIMDLRPATISGIVYQDTDGNGVNTSEPALLGWTIYLDENLNATRDLATTNHASGDVGKAIADVNVTSSVLSVSASVGPISDVNVTLNISHKSNSQLGIYLLSPWGDRIKLAANLPGRGFTNTTLDDEAGIAISSGPSPYSGTFRPLALLSTLDGFSANGTWTLEVHDNTTGQTGTINSWSLSISTAERASVSSASGAYSFTSLPAGNYVAREVLQSGWTLTQPAPGYYALVAAPAAVFDDYDFGNRPADLIAPTVLSSTINDGLIQRSRIREISVQFSEPVAIGSAFALLSRRMSTPMANVSVSWSVDPDDSRLYRLTFTGSAVQSGSLPDGLFTLKVLAGGITDLSGNAMTADYALSFHCLFGDFDGDRDVDSADQALFKKALNHPASYAWYMDFDADNDVDNADLLQFKDRVRRLVL